MQAVHVAFLKIWKLGRNSLDVAGKIVNIEHHAKHILLLKPFWCLQLFSVTFFQFRPSLFVKGLHLAAKLCKHGTIVIKLHIKPSQFIQMPVQAVQMFVHIPCHCISPSLLCPFSCFISVR